MDLPAHLHGRLVALDQMGAEVDRRAAVWLTDQTGDFDQAALKSIAEARRLIELTVDIALSSGCAAHPAVVQMQKQWLDRFDRIGEGIRTKQIALGHEAQLRAEQTHAAKAYIKTEGLA